LHAGKRFIRTLNYAPPQIRFGRISLCFAPHQQSLESILSSSAFNPVLPAIEFTAAAALDAGAAVFAEHFAAKPG
jgi:hypothetical protein